MGVCARVRVCVHWRLIPSPLVCVYLLEEEARVVDPIVAERIPYLRHNLRSEVELMWPGLSVGYITQGYRTKNRFRVRVGIGITMWAGIWVGIWVGVGVVGSRIRVGIWTAT